MLKIFSGPITFRIERLEPSPESWTVRREIHFTSRHELVNLGEMNLPAALDTRWSCFLRYRVTVDADDNYQEFNEGNNSQSYPVSIEGRRGRIIYEQAGAANPPTLTCAETGDFLGATPEFQVSLRNCTDRPVSGTIRINQTGRWPDEPLTRSHRP